MWFPTKRSGHRVAHSAWGGDSWQGLQAQEASMLKCDTGQPEDVGTAKPKNKDLWVPQMFCSIWYFSSLAWPWAGSPSNHRKRTLVPSRGVRDCGQVSFKEKNGLTHL